MIQVQCKSLLFTHMASGSIGVCVEIVWTLFLVSGRCITSLPRRVEKNFTQGLSRESEGHRLGIVAHTVCVQDAVMVTTG